MALTLKKFDDECEIPPGSLDWREIAIGSLLCLAMGIALAYVSMAPVWIIIVLSILSLLFVFKSVKE